MWCWCGEIKISWAAWLGELGGLPLKDVLCVWWYVCVGKSYIWSVCACESGGGGERRVEIWKEGMGMHVCVSTGMTRLLWGGEEGWMGQNGPIGMCVHGGDRRGAIGVMLKEKHFPKAKKKSKREKSGGGKG